MRLMRSAHVWPTRIAMPKHLAEKCAAMYSIPQMSSCQILSVQTMTLQSLNESREHGLHTNVVDEDLHIESHGIPAAVYRVRGDWYI